MRMRSIVWPADLSSTIATAAPTSSVDVDSVFVRASSFLKADAPTTVLSVFVTTVDEALLLSEYLNASVPFRSLDLTFLTT